jgi:hypothetical protein
VTLNDPVLHYRDVLPLLATSVVGFEASPEFERASDFPELGGIALGALASYLHRIRLEPDQQPELASGLHAVEQLSQRGDPDVRNEIVTEFLHAVANHDGVLLDDLGPATRSLYERWVDTSDV